ncbi:hypothetical protein [Saccharothrix xinjiangensis]|uniref:J domain-containing protein n=1 Tax=Saccharothrix xinjiangensis TaxID=204798 RepID=A0ABV9Y1E0_9PSEU
MRRRSAEFRAFVRANHPDVGGDPDAFALGLAALREELDERWDAPVVVERRPWWRLLRRKPRRDLT